jgi:hypothetical protein
MLSTGQIIFILFLLGLIYVININRSVLLHRSILLTIVALGILFVIFPSLTSLIASLVGIGRGTDLIFYLFIFFSLFIIVYQMSEINKLNQKITEVIRNLSIQNARKFPGKSLESSKKRYSKTGADHKQAD